MRNALLALLPLLASPEAPAEYVPYHLHELVAVAERVVCGRITALQEQTFDLAVDRVLVGSPVGELRLRRFENDGCASRWGAYEVGQRVLLFLTGDRVLGAGDEGEWPMTDSGAAALVPFGDDGQFHAWVRPARAIPIAEIAAAVRGYRELFQLLDATDRSFGGTGAVLCFASDDVAAARAYADSSAFAKQLYEQTLFSRGFVSPRPAPPLAAEPVIRARADGFCSPPLPEKVATGDGLQHLVCPFAASLCVPGDLDGDGRDELALSGDEKVFWIVFCDSAGRVTKRHRLVVEELGLGNVLLWPSMAAPGDLDRDGVPDLVVGASDVSDTGKPGRAWVLFLDRAGGVKRTLPLAAPGAAPGASLGFGYSLTSMGDLEGDGSCALVVAESPLFGGSDILVPGEVSALSLCYLDRAGAAFSRVQPLPLDGARSPYVYDVLAGLGDLDGDGIGELALGTASVGGGEDDAVEIVHLGRDGVPRARQRIPGSDFDPRTGGGFGYSLAAPGDLDGDGVPDLVVGGWKELWILLLTRAGGVKDARSFGLRSGGFVPLQSIRSLAVLRGPKGERRLAVAGEPGHPDDAFVYVLGLGPGATLRKP